MIMADVLKIVFLILGFQIVYVCYWLASEALFPSFVDRACAQYQSHAFKITLLGVLVFVPLVFAGIAIGKMPNPFFKFVGVFLGSVPVLLGLLGSAGLSRRIGIGLPSSLDETQPWRRGLRGGIVLVFVFLLPVIGWFVVMPLTIASGVGAAIIAWTQRKKQIATPPLAETKA